MPRASTPLRTPPLRPRLTVPAVVAVSFAAAPACSGPAPALPNACVTRYEPPASTPAPPASVRPQVDLAPCSATWTGPDWFCVTASGCQVEYVGGTMPAPGAAVRVVTCPDAQMCVWGMTAEGIPTPGACPQLALQPQSCTNVLRFDEPGASGFNCSATRAGCALGGGATGMETSYVRRTVRNEVEASRCPTECTPFA